MALIHRSALTPMLGRWNVLILEDTDRLNDISGNALLKSLEEPGPHTVWVLCAPTPEDVLPTIVSRARHLRLRTPTTGQVTEVLVARDGVIRHWPRSPPGPRRDTSAGHARWPATSRFACVGLRCWPCPARCGTSGSCFIAAQNLLEAATSDARAITDPLDAAELERALQAFGEGATGTVAARIRRMAAAATKELEARQKSRRTRTVRDQLDRALLDLTGALPRRPGRPVRGGGRAHQRRAAPDRGGDGGALVRGGDHEPARTPWMRRGSPWRHRWLRRWPWRP